MSFMFLESDFHVFQSKRAAKDLVHALINVKYWMLVCNQKEMIELNQRAMKSMLNMN